MADEKVSTESPNIIHDEKHSIAEDAQPGLAEQAGRRKSVALNIIHNPLKVRPQNLTLRRVAW